jgi:hypothetical protein
MQALKHYKLVILWQSASFLRLIAGHKITIIYSLQIAAYHLGQSSQANHA